MAAPDQLHEEISERLDRGQELVTGPIDDEATSTECGVNVGSMDESVGRHGRRLGPVTVEEPGFVELSDEDRRDAVAALAVLLRPLIEVHRQRRIDECDAAREDCL